MAELQVFLAEQAAKGTNYQIAGQGVPEVYVPGQLHTQIGFGGPDGLRAIGYVAQTFFAHCFPALARDDAMQPFIEYTISGTGEHLVWWDFDAPTQTPNAFPLGHRIIVGVDEVEGTAYARVSLFSTLDFSMVFCKPTTITSSSSVINDIDPLALKMPDDLVQTREPAAVAPVKMPANPTAGLYAAITNGDAEKRMTLLMKRAEDHNRRLDAGELLLQLTAALSVKDKEKILREFWSDEPQRVWRLLNFGLTTLKQQRSREPLAALFIDALEQATERDPTSSTGVTSAAKTALTIASTALVKAMTASIKDKSLDQDKTEMFIGGGVGADAAVRALLSHKFPRLPL